MNRVRILLETQSDVLEFVNTANKIKEEVYLVDNTYNVVNGKSLLGCLYSLEFNEIWVESECKNLSNIFSKFLC